MEAKLEFSSYKKIGSIVEFITDQHLELFDTKREKATNTLLILVPTFTLLLPMIWASFNGYPLSTNVLMLSVSCIIGMILQFIFVSSLESRTNINELKMIFSPEGFTIDSIKRGKTTIEPCNIQSIYIHSEEHSSSTDYDVYCKFKKAITLPINKKKLNEIELFGTFQDESTLAKAKKMIAEIKQALNLRENLYGDNKYLATEDTEFEEHENKITIATTATKGFFNNNNMLDILDIAFIVVLAIGFILGPILFGIFFNDMNSCLIFLAFFVFIIIAYAIYQVNKTPNKIIYTITPQEIKIETDKNQRLSIPSDYIQKISLDRVKEYVKTGKNSGFYADFDNIFILLNRQISLYPLKLLKRDKISMFGNIKLVKNEYSQVMTNAIAKMIQKF